MHLSVPVGSLYRMSESTTAGPIGPQIRIRSLREAHGLSVKQLIERIAEQGIEGVHQDTIRNVELGHKPASMPLMTAWAKALGVNPLDVYQPARSTHKRIAS